MGNGKKDGHRCVVEHSLANARVYHRQKRILIFKSAIHCFLYLPTLTKVFSVWRVFICTMMQALDLNDVSEMLRRRGLEELEKLRDEEIDTCILDVGNLLFTFNTNGYACISYVTD